MSNDTSQGRRGRPGRFMARGAGDGRWVSPSRFACPPWFFLFVAGSGSTGRLPVSAPMSSPRRWFELAVSVGRPQHQGRRLFPLLDRYEERRAREPLPPFVLLDGPALARRRLFSLPARGPAFMASDLAASPLALLPTPPPGAALFRGWRQMIGRPRPLPRPVSLAAARAGGRKVRFRSDQPVP